MFTDVPVQILLSEYVSSTNTSLYLGENTSNYKPARQLHIQIWALHVYVGLSDSIIQNMFELVQRNNETSLLLELWGCLDDTHSQPVL